MRAASTAARSRSSSRTTAYQVPKAVQACNKLINRDKVFAFVAPLGTPMNNACFKDQFAVGVPNLFPLSAARSMYEPYERLKFYGAASYVDQVRSGIDYFVKTKGKKAVCVMYQDTDFGKEVLEGAEQQTKKLGIKLVETHGAQADRPGLHRADRQAALGRLRPDRHGHHRARLDRALHDGAQGAAGTTSTSWARPPSTTWSSAPRRAWKASMAWA